MGQRPELELQKQGLHRSLAVERVLSDGRVATSFVKRFESQGAWRRLFDGRRARREVNGLRLLSQHGLPVPRFLSLQRHAAAWELRTEWIEGALSLRAWLAAGGIPGASRARVARRLGQLLARALEAGFEHLDPHPENVLVDGAERIWLLDAGALRRHRRWTQRTLAKVWIAWAASLRELAAPTFRQRIWCACSRAVAGGLRARLQPSDTTLAGWEAAARSLRRARLATQAQRWLRPSSAVQLWASAAERGWLRRGNAAEEGAQVARCLQKAVIASSAAGWSEHCDPVTGRNFQLYRGDSQRVRELWLSLARLEMHALPAARPVLYLEQPYALLVAAANVEAKSWTPTPAESTQNAGAAGAVFGAMHDRGFACSFADCRLELRSAGRALLLPKQPIAALPLDLPATWQSLHAVLAPLSVPARAAFVNAYVCALAGGQAERQQARRELQRD